MPEVVMVSKIDTPEKLTQTVEELFRRGRYDEITQAIGMYSLMLDYEHTLADQDRLYHQVLQLIKNKIKARDAKKFSSWLTAFPKIMSQVVKKETIVTDKATAVTIASQQSAYGPFRSVDDFFFWALDDRRLPLSAIIKYLEKTLTMHRG
jgi:hypothetical protein